MYFKDAQQVKTFPKETMRPLEQKTLDTPVYSMHSGWMKYYVFAAFG